jgi:hypothetical protein
MGKEIDEQYSEDEAKRRFEAALRGAREVGHESMKDITPKRPKTKTGAKANRHGKGGRDA